MKGALRAIVVGLVAVMCFWMGGTNAWWTGGASVSNALEALGPGPEEQPPGFEKQPSPEEQSPGLGESFTVESVWPGAGKGVAFPASWLSLHWAENGLSEEASRGMGLSDQPSGVTTLTLTWVEEPSGFFPVRKLEMHITRVDGDGESLANLLKPTDTTLLTSVVGDEADYSVVLSFEASLNLLHVAVFKHVTGLVLSGEGEGGFHLPEPFVSRTVLLPEGWVEGTPSLEVVSEETPVVTVSSFMPVATQLRVGHGTDAGTLVSTDTLAYGNLPGLSLRTGEPFPGEFHVSVQSSGIISDEQTEAASLTEATGAAVAVIDPAEGIQVVALPPDRVGEGMHTVTVRYVRDGVPVMVRTASMAVTKQVAFDAFVTDVDGEAGVMSGYVTAKSAAVSSTEPWDEPVHVSATLTHLAWNEAEGDYDEGDVHGPVTVFQGFIDDLLEGDATSGVFQLPVPESPALWQVNFQIEVDPKVEKTAHGLSQRFFLGSDTPAELVAATDQASEQIVVFDAAATDWNRDEAIHWAWAPTERNGFAGLTRGWGAPSGVKLRESELWGGLWMVVVDSKGLAAIVPYPAGDSRRWGQVISGNLHSAELLPDGNIAIAASTGGFVRVYTSSQGPDASKYVEYRFPGAHGVLWDPQLELLWALGDDDLIAFQVGGTPDDPTLTVVRESALPTRGGHDLAPVYGNTDRLWITTVPGVYQYEKSTDTWITDFPGSESLQLRNVKGIGNWPSGRIAYSQQKAGTLHSWTTDEVNLVLPEEVRLRERAAFYKARIWRPEYQ